jgi:hypothetical protein
MLFVGSKMARIHSGTKHEEKYKRQLKETWSFIQKSGMVSN